MHGVVMLLRLVTPMALAVVGDPLLHAAPCPRLIGFHLLAPVGHSLRLHAGHGLYPPRATRSALAPRWQGVARWARRGLGDTSTAAHRKQWPEGQCSRRAVWPWSHR